MNSDSSSEYSSIYPIPSLFFNPKRFNAKQRFMRIEYFYSSLREKKFEHGGTAIYKFYKESLRSGPLETTQNWLSKGLFIRSDKPSFYLHEQEFEFRGRRHVRKSLVVAIDVLSPKIFNHEQTFHRGIKFHYKLLKNTHKNFEPIFLMYRGIRITGHINEAKHLSFLDYEDEYANLHRFYQVSMDRDFLESVKESAFVVANGHHRIEAAKLWCKERNHRFRLAEIVNVEDTELKILPTHRCILFTTKTKVEEIKKGYLVEKIDVSSPIEDMVFNLHKNQAILFDGSSFYLVSKERVSNPDKVSLAKMVSNVSVFWFHTEVLKRLKVREVKYFRSPDEVLDCARESGGWAVLLPPPEPNLVFEVASAGKLMPQKSTDFYPKLLAGTIILDLDSI